MCDHLQECTNDCCNANNCTLKEGAQCAHGVCCEGCKVRDTHMAHKHLCKRQLNSLAVVAQYHYFNVSLPVSALAHCTQSTCQLLSQCSSLPSHHTSTFHLCSHLTFQMEILTCCCNMRPNSILLTEETKY